MTIGGIKRGWSGWSTLTEGPLRAWAMSTANFVPSGESLDYFAVKK